MIDSKTLNRPLNPLWTELPVIRGIGGQGMFKKHYLKPVCIPICICVWSGNKEIVSCIESYYIITPITLRYCY